MSFVDNILEKIEDCIRQNRYEPVETEKLELKPTPPNLKGAASLLESVCAFMNTAKGIVIIGIQENNNKTPKNYELKGYNEDFEGSLKDFATQFTDKEKNHIDVSECIGKHEIRDFMDKRVCILYINELPADKKYAFYNEKAYKRVYTGDHEVSEKEIKVQEEFKEDIKNARELETIGDATLNDLDIDSLNDYIHRINRDVKVETVKKDIEEAKPFLTRKKFIIEDNITLLGMLVCGRHVNDFLGWRVQVDGFVDIPAEIAQDKKSMIDNIIPLMERSLSYILKNTQTGISIERGGSSKPEYPEELLRETINNALAHRDYNIDKYININIKPDNYIEIRNPGSFKERLLLEADLTTGNPVRRIIPDSTPRNPKLAGILKVFDKWEGKARGMSNLVNAALANTIDLPYYRFHSKNELSLFIKKGKLLDERMESLFTMYSGYISHKLNSQAITTEQKMVLTYFYKSDIENNNDRYTILLTKDNNHLHAINSLADSGLIVRHPTASNNLYPVFITDSLLFKKNHIDELRELFGADYGILSQLSKDILNCIYEFNTYSATPYPSANQVGDILWWQRGGTGTFNNFETFKREVRKNISAMHKREILRKINDKYRYQLNKSFNRRPSLYD